MNPKQGFKYSNAQEVERTLHSMATSQRET